MKDTTHQKQCVFVIRFFRIYVLYNECYFEYTMSAKTRRHKPVTGRSYPPAYRHLLQIMISAYLYHNDAFCVPKAGCVKVDDGPFQGPFSSGGGTNPMMNPMLALSPIGSSLSSGF